jgi:hypothetical protein
VLENLGVIHLFQICNQAAASEGSFQCLEHGDASKVDVTRTCLEAHNTLIAINPENAAKFKDVTQFLAENLRKLESGEEK